MIINYHLDLIFPVLRQRQTDQSYFDLTMNANKLSGIVLFLPIGQKLYLD